MRRWITLAGVLFLTGSIPAQRPIDFTARDRVVDAAFSSDARLIGYTLRQADTLSDRFDDRVFVLPSGGGSPTVIGEGSAIAFAPAGDAIARLTPVDGELQLAVRDSMSGADRMLTSMPYGVTAFRFSPDGTRLAFMADGSEVFAKGRRFAGSDRSGREALFVVSLSSGVVRRLTGGEVAPGAAFAEQPGAVPFDWVDDSSIVLSARIGGSGESADGATLHLVSAANATRRYLIGTGGRWVSPVVSPDGRWIAFTGQPIPRGPWSATELLIVHPDGTKLKRLTVGLDRDVGDVAWSDDSKSIWFATEDRGTRNLHRIDIGSGKEREQTTGRHTLQIVASSRRDNEVLAIRATPEIAGSLVLVKAGNPAMLRAIREPGAPVATGEIGQFEVRAQGGTVIEAILYRPPGFVLGQAAPLLIDVHGGPHAMAGAGYAPWALAHAASGALVLRVNPRGSTGYGFDLVNGLHRNWPGQDVADISLALDELLAEGLVDTARIAVVGTGAGAVTAVALAKSDPRVSRVIARCSGGGWLPGGSGYDAPIWSEWYAARPLRMAPALWQAQSPLIGLSDAGAPTLIIAGQSLAPIPTDFAGALAAALTRADVAHSFVRITGRCGEAGPVTQAALIELERSWLKSGR